MLTTPSLPNGPGLGVVVARVLTDSFMVGRRAPVDTLDVWVLPLSLATVGVLAGASVLDIPLLGENDPGELVEVLLCGNRTPDVSLPVVEAGMTVFDLLGITTGGRVGPAVGTVTGGGVTLSGICDVCVWLVTAGAVGFVVVSTNLVVVTTAVALVIVSVFTLGVKAGGVAPGPLPGVAVLVLVTAGATIVVVVATTPAAIVIGAGVALVFGVVAASVSFPSALMPLRRKPEEEKRKPIVNQRVAKVAIVGTVNVQLVKFCHLEVRFRVHLLPVTLF